MLIGAIYRAVVFYFLIMIIIRVLGKREVGELSIADLIVLLIIADIAVVSIENQDHPFYIYIIAIICIAIIQKILAYLSLKSNFVRNLIDGKPSIIMSNGKLNIREMRKQKYTVDDLLSQSRDKDIASLHEINYAILETSGDLSVFKKGTDKPLPVIVSGQLLKENLQIYNKDETWINEELDKRNKRIKDVYYADINSKGELSVLDSFE